MIREKQSVGQDDVLAPSGRENHHLGDVVWRQRLAALVHGVGLGLVAVEADDGEFLFSAFCC